MDMDIDCGSSSIYDEKEDTEWKKLDLGSDVDDKKKKGASSILSGLALSGLGIGPF